MRESFFSFRKNAATPPVYLCDMVKRFGLSKTERLKSRKQIDSLFAGGKGFSVFPIRVTYLFAKEAESGVKMGVTVSKRNFKKATDRNRVKRLLREAYRLQKEELQTVVQAKEKSAAVFFIYTGKTIAPFQEIKVVMAKCLKKLSVIANSENPQ
jgi:ribonuclease P protein component